MFKSKQVLPVDDVKDVVVVKPSPFPETLYVEEGYRHFIMGDTKKLNGERDWNDTSIGPVAIYKFSHMAEHTVMHKLETK